MVALARLLFAADPAHAAVARVNPTSLTGKLIMGYQGWFACPGDPPGRNWVHWSSGDLGHGGPPTVEMLPDPSELSPAERCSTGLTAADGEPVVVFSSRNPATVDRHFAWMQEYGLDGVALQRFGTQLLRPDGLSAADVVLANVRAAAERHGRVFFVMYDLSGLTSDDLPKVVQDWSRLQAEGITGSPAYLHHRGHPLLGLWGLGFAGRPITAVAAAALIARLADLDGGVTLLGGVPAGWRTGGMDAAPDSAWQAVWPRLAVISPWTVGRYVDRAGADRYLAATLAPDLAAARRLGADYMPVVFPGFSWANLMQARHAAGKAVRNQIPRDCGRFYWRQVGNALAAGVGTIYGAMFDEVDEGTAMFKLVATAAQSPLLAPVAGQTAATDARTATFLTLDADGCKLPSDWYLRLAGAATVALHRHKMPVPDPTPPQPSR